MNQVYIPVRAQHTMKGKLLVQNIIHRSFKIYCRVLENEDHTHGDSHDRILEATEIMFQSTLQVNEPAANVTVYVVQRKHFFKIF